MCITKFLEPWTLRSALVVIYKNEKEKFSRENTAFCIWFNCRDKWRKWARLNWFLFWVNMRAFDANDVHAVVVISDGPNEINMNNFDSIVIVSGECFSSKGMKWDARRGSVPLKPYTSRFHVVFRESQSQLISPDGAADVVHLTIFKHQISSQNGKTNDFSQSKRFLSPP